MDTCVCVCVCVWGGYTYLLTSYLFFTAGICVECGVGARITLL